MKRSPPPTSVLFVILYVFFFYLKKQDILHAAAGNDMPSLYRTRTLLPCHPHAFTAVLTLSVRVGECEIALADADDEEVENK